ncbi:MinD/ParA family protein [Desulfobaculum bizertense]|uniref:Flagellar biosynthesis protein FlhG n=1 Tax=Desulfobaculum bizertense DSM 18034 TaxID=1121442 RepID=A0A1T4W3L7_9BACT|nr:MinD/ParA family protein [Desulfobaculum bizertense]UIJ38769.1 MinD/ParA family protein [Desulfobaculum bizertense]SKA71832.1 flagellar biosynthesis protein FlhG [Desulfobaculum bizertense DSM 18034]
MDNSGQEVSSFSIVSGKGGVGKTNLALNLGYALHKASHQVILMDCDLGLANLDVLLGLAPDKNLQDLLMGNASVEEIVVPIESPNFDFLPSASGVPELIDLDEDLQNSIFDKLKSVMDQYDFLLMDIGAGISKTVLRFASLSKERIVVISPEPTSLTDSYALIKVLSTEYNIRSFRIVVNQVESLEDGKMSFARLNSACKRFLNLELSYLGAVRTDPAVPTAVIRQVPLLKYAPSSKAGKDILALAVKLKRIREKQLEEHFSQENS